MLGLRSEKGAVCAGLMHIAQTGAMDIRGTSTCCIALMMGGKTLQVSTPPTTSTLDGRSVWSTVPNSPFHHIPPPPFRGPERSMIKT